MAKYTKEQLQERFKRLPPLLKDAMFNPDVAEKMVAIGQKFGLHVEKIGALAEESGYLIMGLTRPSDFATILADRLGVRIDQAREIASELNHQIFAPLRNELKSMFQIELSQEEFQKEPLPLSRPSILPSLLSEQKNPPAVPAAPKISSSIPPQTPPSHTIPPSPMSQTITPSKPAPAPTKPVPSSPPVKPTTPVTPKILPVPPLVQPDASLHPVVPSPLPPKPMPPQIIPPPPPAKPPKSALPQAPPQTSSPPPPPSPPLPPSLPPPSKIPPIDLRGQTKPLIPLAAAIPAAQPTPTKPSSPTPPQAPLPPQTPQHPKYQGSDPYREPAE